MKNHTAKLIVVVAALTVAACSDDGSGDDPIDRRSFVEGSWLSECFDGVKHKIRYSGIDFAVDTFRFRTRSCQGKVSRAGRNVMTGRFLIGETITTSEGLTATEVDYIYDQGAEDRLYFVDPMPYDVAYYDATSGKFYLGFKPTRFYGTLPRNRPTAVDFNNGYTRL